MFRITFDPEKRARTLRERGLNFEDAATLDEIDDRFDYDEERWIMMGVLREKVVVIVWTPRGGARRVISMRAANGEEQAEYWRRLGDEGVLDR